jgi:hypothetical protein
MVELGVPLGVIQTFVGHLSARMVGHYTHITTGAARKVVELLDAQPILAPMLTGMQEVIQGVSWGNSWGNTKCPARGHPVSHRI